MAISREEISQIAKATADEVMDRVSLEREERELCDHIIGGAMGEGAIPLYGRETRKEPCSCCMIDPEGPNAPENRMCTTKGAIGTLSNSEEREWCSEIKIVSDGRCARARSIREAARVCKEKYPEDTAKFFECYAPAFSKITKGSNPGVYIVDDIEITIKYIRPGVHEVSFLAPPEGLPEETLTKIDKLIKEKIGILNKGGNPGDYVTITSQGGTTFKVGEVISREAFERENERVKKLGGKPATGR